MANHSVNSGRRAGRPKKGEPPRVPYEELDRILVFGEVVTCEDGVNTTVHYPSYRDLARRYGVSNAVIARYAKEHQCQRRREVAKGRVAAKADQKLVELRAHALAMSKDDQVRIIDGYLLAFEKALAEGRVRCDNPSDFNLLCRLREFILGGADSRQEMHASLSLEVIQGRHRQLLRTRQESTPATRGELPDARDQRPFPNPPASPASLPAPGPEKATAHKVVGSAVNTEAAGWVPGPVCDGRAAAPASLDDGRGDVDADADGGDSGTHEATVAPTGATMAGSEAGDAS
jgi:hypothetical protein